MLTTTRRLTRYPELTDNPDVPRDILRVAQDLDDAPGFNRGLLAARVAGRFEGDIYWATDDLTMGATGTPSVWTSGAWRLWTHPNDAVAATASARTLGTGAQQAAAGNDARLSDARTPLAHGASHRIGGSDALSVRAANAVQVKDVGQAAQIRAGRALTVADFTSMGLSQPVGLFNLSDLTNLGSGGALVNKGAVPFAPGITGAAAEAAQFAGSTAQALYIADTGSADPFRIRTGSWGCWFKTAKRGTTQEPIAKITTVGNQIGWSLQVTTANVMTAIISTTGTDVFNAAGTTDVCDDRWHLALGTCDGSLLRLYIDGTLEASVQVPGSIFASSAPLNIGGRAADAATANAFPHFGRVDEAFVTSDVLNEDQVRLLYAVKVPHGLAVVPSAVRMGVRRSRRGAALAQADFPTPANALRIYNTTNQTITDSGSNAVMLTSGAQDYAPGPDGSVYGARYYNGVGSDSATDAGLPAALASRSYGIWFKTAFNSGGTLVSWGTMGTSDARLEVYANTLRAISGGQLIAWPSGSVVSTGGAIADGTWHHAVVVENDTAADGVKQKLYLDGRLVAAGTALTSLTLAGAGRFRIGSAPDGTTTFTGQLSRAFVYAGALTQEQVAVLYQKGSQALITSPKNSGDHVEGMDATNLYVIGDALEPQYQIDLSVSA